MSKFHKKRRVEFSETDMAGIAHFSQFFCYMEETEHDFFRSLGLSVMMEIEGKRVSWPRVSCSFDYKAPVKFEQELDIYLKIEKLGKKSLTYVVEIMYKECLMAIGRMTIVCCEYDNTNKMVSIPIPEIFLNKFQDYV